MGNFICLSAWVFPPQPLGSHAETWAKSRNEKKKKKRHFSNPHFLYAANTGCSSRSWLENVGVIPEMQQVANSERLLALKAKIPKWNVNERSHDFLFFFFFQLQRKRNQNSPQLENSTKAVQCVVARRAGGKNKTCQVRENNNNERKTGFSLQWDQHLTAGNQPVFPPSGTRKWWKAVTRDVQLKHESTLCVWDARVRSVSVVKVSDRLTSRPRLSFTCVIYELVLLNDRDFVLPFDQLSRKTKRSLT